MCGICVVGWLLLVISLLVFGCYGVGDVFGIF